MSKQGIPKTEIALKLLQDHFLSRKDVLAFLAPWGKPRPCDVIGNIEDILAAHIAGQNVQTAKIQYRKRNGSQVVTSGRFRIGTYMPNHDNQTRCLCIDFDGKGHADALEDPERAAIDTLLAFKNKNLPAYLEKSGGGFGWHLWCFFKEPISADKARALSLTLLPNDIKLENGSPADPSRSRGVEIFPKQDKVKNKGYGNLVWLPWCSEAGEGCNVFYQKNGNGALNLHIPGHFDTVDEGTVDQIISSIPKPSTPIKVNPPQTETEFKGAWKEWRTKALAALPLESVYGQWLTGQMSGDGWLECRDPSSASGDRNPSAGVSDGSNQTERGAFHSFISGSTISVFDFLIQQSMTVDFRSAVERVAEISGISTPQLPGDQQPPPTKRKKHFLPEIQVNNRQLRNIIDDTWRVVNEANRSKRFIPGLPKNRPFLFVRSGKLVRLRFPNIQKDEDHIDIPMIENLDETTVYGMLARVADWIKETDSACLPTRPVKDVAKDMMVYPDPSLPCLENVISTPVFGRDGTLIITPGYHEKHCLWFFPAQDLDLDSVNLDPSKPDIRSAIDLFFKDLLADFPFTRQSDRTHLLSALLLPFVRRMIDGCTPLHLIQAPRAGSGKGLLCKLISIISTGEEIDGRTLSTQEDEARKMLTAELSKAKPIILLDNANDKVKLHCPPLASVITSDKWADRILGKSDIISLPNKALWILTGNNPNLSMEIARRCINIHIDPRVDRPWLRSEFRHKDIMGWTKKNRSRLVHAAIIIVQAWIKKGCPKAETTLGSFEMWSAVMGGIMEVSDIPGFLGDLNEMYEDSDGDGQEWRVFIEAWWNKFGSEHMRVSELNDLCNDMELLLPERGDGSPLSQQSRLGRRLSKMRDGVFGNWRIQKVHFHSVKRGITYALELLNNESDLKQDETAILFNGEVSEIDLNDIPEF